MEKKVKTKVHIILKDGKAYAVPNLPIVGNDGYLITPQHRDWNLAIANALPVLNPEIEDWDTFTFNKTEPYLWPGTAEIVKRVHCDDYHAHEKESCFIKEVKLHLPSSESKQPEQSDNKK